MEKREEIIKGDIINFSQDKNKLISSNPKYVFNQFNINYSKNINSTINFNKGNNRYQNININNNDYNSNRIFLNEGFSKKYILRSQSKETPIKIKNEENNKFLPLLQNEIKINDSQSSKECVLKSKKNFGKFKKGKDIKLSTNKSYFSVDKVKVKKKNIVKKNVKKNFGVTNETKNYINTFKSQLNNLYNDNTYKFSPIISSNSKHKKRGYSSYSVRSIKRKKLKIKNKVKIGNNKSSSNIVKSIAELKNDLTIKKPKSKEFNNNNNSIYSNIFIQQNNFVNRTKIYDFSITKFSRNNQSNINKNISYNNNIISNEESGINIGTKSNCTSQTIKKQTQMFFYIYHFFKTNNLYFFIPNSKYEQIKDKIIKDNSPNTMKNYEIIEDFYLPPAFRPRMNKWSNMPECITGTCKNGGFALIKNFDNCNLIWRLFHPNKMKLFMRNIHNNQKYNHFISTFHLGRKDNLYKHFKYYKRIFPEMFNYAPATYILPIDGPDFENEYRKNKKALWIVKPVNLSRGRGIHLLRGESEFKYLYKKSTQLTVPQYLISKYIDRPHLLNNKKYDLRIYVLVASFAPLRIYLYNNGLVRFATEDYKRGDLDNVFIHLTNYSINKNNLKYKSNQNLKNQQCELFPREETEGTEAEGGLEGEILDDEMGEENENGDENIPDDDSNKWSLIEYRNYFKKIGKGNIMDMIWSQIEAIVIKTIISVSTEFYKNIFPSKINNSFELYGFDILIDEKFRAWLIEVNVNPSLHCTSPLDLSIKTDLISDIFNVVGILPYNHNGNKSVYNYTMINKKKEENTAINKKIKNIDINKLAKTEREEFNSKMSIKSTILRNFEPDKLEKKMPEYDDEFYKKLIELFNEEKSRSHSTEFNLLFPLKNNIKTYGEILIKDNAVNDYNIVLWQHILTH